MSRVIVIDTSNGNETELDYAAIKNAGIPGVILRAGYGSDINQKDASFDKGYQMAKDAGLSVGAYWFNYFRSEDDARAEAETFLRVCDGKDLALGMWSDYEEDTIAYMNRIGCNLDYMDLRIKAFVERVKASRSDTLVGWYTNPHCLFGCDGKTEPLRSEVLGDIPFWLADYRNSQGRENTTYPGTNYNGMNCVGHQFANPDYLIDQVRDHGTNTIDTSIFELGSLIDNEPVEDHPEVDGCVPSFSYGVNIGGNDQWLSSVNTADANINDSGAGCAGKDGRTIEAVYISTPEDVPFNGPYMVHDKAKNRWLPKVDTNNGNTSTDDGYAGNIGNEIDAIAIGINSEEFDLEYQVMTSDGHIYPPVRASQMNINDNNIGYAGSLGKTISRLSIKVVRV